MTTRNYSATAQATTLTALISDTDTTIPVAGTTGFPAAPFLVCLEMDTAFQEVVLVTAVSGLSLTVVRGYDSTTAVAHTAGATVTHTHSAIDFRDSRTHEGSNSGVHGVTGAVVGTTDTQAVTNKDVSDGSNKFPAQLVYRLVAVGGVYPARPANAVCVEWVGPTAPPGAVSGDTYVVTPA